MQRAIKITGMLMFLLCSQISFASNTVKGPWDTSGAGKNIGGLASSICTSYNLSNSIAYDVKQLIKKHTSKYEGIQNPTKAQMVKFLNHNKHFVTCVSGKNYMKASFDTGKAYDQLFNVLFFDELLLDDDSLWVDINAISLHFVTGEPETVLDYMYRQYNDKTNPVKTRNEIQRLIDMFEQYLGGKRFTQLPAHVQRAWLDYAKTQASR